MNLDQKKDQNMREQKKLNRNRKWKWIPFFIPLYQTFLEDRLDIISRCIGKLLGRAGFEPA